MQTASHGGVTLDSRTSWATFVHFGDPGSLFCAKVARWYAEALAYGWEHWNRVRRMASPVAYLYRVGQSRTRPRKVRTLIERHPDVDVWCEPGLPSALAALPERQRVVVVLVHGFGWTLTEVGELIGLRKTTIQNHLERAMTSLRAHLEEPVDERT